MNAEGKNVISLAIGSPDMPPSPETIETLCAEAQRSDAHGYQPTAGIPQLREAMAAFYKRWFDVELNPETEIQPLIGSKEGILHTTLAFVNPGEKVLVPNPGYPTYTSLSKIWVARWSTITSVPNMVGNRISTNSNGWTSPMCASFGATIPICPPEPQPCELPMSASSILPVCHGIVVVNDNPYSFILGHEHLSILQVPGAKECCIEFNSMSKSHNMPGWRVGMLSSNATFVKWILTVKSNIDSGTFRPLQLAAAKAYANSDEWHEQANVEVYARRRNLAGEIMDALGCSYDPSQVGMFLWGRIPDAYGEAESLTERVLQEAHVFITPGFIFGTNGQRYVRISLCAKEEKLQEALDRIRKVFC